MSSSANPLITTLQQNPDLSTLNRYINSSTNLQNLLSNANNFTFLAPTNEAFFNWVLGGGNQTADVLEATISYHLLNGSYPTIDITDEPQFVSTSLTNRTYENITMYPPGQRVELVTGSNGQPQVLSNNKTASSITTKDTLCLGGLIQAVNRVLTIPVPIVTLTTQASLNYFIAILNRANFLSINSAGLIEFVNEVTTTPDLTFFIPNSAEALATFTNISSSLTAENLTDLFNYHIIYGNVAYSPSLQNGTILKSAEGSDLTITRDEEDIYVNSAKVITPDYMTVNGVFHVIDSVLDRFNQTIPPQIPRANSTSNTTSLAPSSKSSGISGGEIAAAVVVPVVFVIALAAFLFWFFRRRKGKKQAHEMGTDGPVGGTGDSKELPGTDPSKELQGSANFPSREMDATSPPSELATPNHRPAAELE